MERHHTATAGSAAVDEEMVLRVDPVNAVEVDKISDSRVAGSCGSQPEEGCDKELPKVVGNNPKHEDSPPPMPHAASSCPQRERCDSESSGPDQRKRIHPSLLPWLEVKEEVRRGIHPHPRRGQLCRSPKCWCFANADNEEFFGYCCKQCGLRRREKDYGMDVNAKAIHL